MKIVQSIIVTAVFAILFSTVVFATGNPETIELPAATMGNVSFQHKKHQDMTIKCSKCHGKNTGKIGDLGKDWAHKTCKGCHTEMSLGPTGCNDCHKK